MATPVELSPLYAPRDAVGGVIGLEVVLFNGFAPATHTAGQIAAYNNVVSTFEPASGGVTAGKMGGATTYRVVGQGISDGSLVWVAATPNTTNNGNMSLISTDGVSFTTYSSGQIFYGYPYVVQVGGEMWVFASHSSGARSIAIMDIATGVWTTRSSTEYSFAQPIYANGRIWVVRSSGAVRGIDPVTLGTVTATLGGTPVTRVQGVEAGGRVYWPSGTSGALHWVYTSTLAVGSIATGVVSNGIAYGDGALWLCDTDKIGTVIASTGSAGTISLAGTYTRPRSLYWCDDRVCIPSESPLIT